MLADLFTQPCLNILNVFVYTCTPLQRCGSFISFVEAVCWDEPNMMDRDWFGQGDHNASKTFEIR